MAETRMEEAIAGAAAYEELHVPAIFSEWTPRVLNAAKVGVGDRVLDVACGTGVLTRAAFQRVGENGKAVGVDPNPAMLAVARRLNDKIDWRNAAAESLPYDDGGFDCVVSQFGMMFFTDRALAVREMFRALVPGGRLAVAVWDSLENTPAYSTAVNMLERMAGNDAANALRAPFVMGDRSELEKLVEDAGGVSLEALTPMGRADFPSLRSMVEADLRGWLPVMGVDLEEELIQEILAEAENELAEFVTEDGRVRFDSPAHIVSAQKPV